MVDDLTQEVWAVLVGGLQKLRLDPDLGSVTGWVVKIANDMAKKHARRIGTFRADSLSLDAADKLLDREPGPDVEFEWVQSERELRQLIESFAASLPEREQRVVVLYWLEELSLSRIAADMMISEDCAWGILRRVSLKLAACLRRRGYGAL
jgi:RNA polymerase sigma factor (sigma-70 family)